MDLKILRSYIEKYKREFDKISKQELYKWEAIKQFQDNFNIEAINLRENIELSLNKAGNLLASGNYYAKRMLLNNTEKSPKKIRELLSILYDEDFDILERINLFQDEFNKLNAQNFPNTNHFQDHRAIIVYLVMKYPDRYYLYKYNMYKLFSQKLLCNYIPKSGKIENIGHYFSICDIIRNELSRDHELIYLHENRLDKNCYRDKDLYVLTQDLIYAIVTYFDIVGKSKIKHTVTTRETKQNKNLQINYGGLKQSEEIEVRIDPINFKGAITNYIHKARENKHIGDLGELKVMEYEENYLKKNGKEKWIKNIQHVAKDKGDGLGYDILSCDLQGNNKFIEVKTTKYGFYSPFFISRVELERSKKEGDSYYLYRLYNYDENANSGDLFIIRGNLEPLCKNIVNYRVTIKN